MANSRKYDVNKFPTVGSAVLFLESLSEKLRELGDCHEADQCKDQADELYAYIARNLQRRKAGQDEISRQARNQSIILRGYQKRIAELEEKLLLIRASTDLHEKGVLTSGSGVGGLRVRMKRRIDHLEAKLLIVRDLTDTSVGKRRNTNIPEKERQIHDSRIRVDVENGLRGRSINNIKATLLKKVIEKGGENER